MLMQSEKNLHKQPRKDARSSSKNRFEAEIPSLRIHGVTETILYLHLYLYRFLFFCCQ